MNRRAFLAGLLALPLAPAPVRKAPSAVAVWGRAAPLMGDIAWAELPAEPEPLYDPRDVEPLDLTADWRTEDVDPALLRGAVVEFGPGVWRDHTPLFAPEPLPR